MFMAYKLGKCTWSHGSVSHLHLGKTFFLAASTTGASPVCNLQVNCHLNGLSARNTTTTGCACTRIFRQN